MEICTKKDLKEFDVVRTRDGEILMLFGNDCAVSGFGFF